MKFNEIKFSIFKKNKRWWVAFYYKNKNYKTTTDLLCTKENLEKVKSEFIPTYIQKLDHENKSLTGGKVIKSLVGNIYFSPDRLVEEIILIEKSLLKLASEDYSNDEQHSAYIESVEKLKSLRKEGQAYKKGMSEAMKEMEE